MNQEITAPKLQSLVNALMLRDELSHEERTLIEGMAMRRKIVRKGDELVAQHSQPSESCIVVKGFTAREVLLDDGKRQITALHIPGDFVDLHAFLLKVMDHSVVALTDCEVGYVPHRELLRVIDRSPHLGRLFWLSTVIDGAIQRAWITSSGRRSATAHLGHLICELYLRLSAADLARDGRFSFPVPQSELADALGFSLVHVNRTLQELRATGFVTWKGSAITITDFDGLAALSQFDPTYLNLIRLPR
ncbi:Crp/Fnr family transcriptional regulator [Bosea sp. 124]|uniref:Crp/Fnr family transcriptional regulator n=1 Tax=Bosea sp. 124 TaxID=2135642 RepID=UPI000D354E04|nr:Crp/Fnr family transcriptional regulator [Bosea sp. 124]PTM40634.1 CRP-like cAMP-binding protein [Bosea sp. 124]